MIDQKLAESHIPEHEWIPETSMLMRLDSMSKCPCQLVTLILMSRLDININGRC